jgi:hypothetical protein
VVTQEVGSAGRGGEGIEPKNERLVRTREVTRMSRRLYISCAGYWEVSCDLAGV